MAEEPPNEPVELTHLLEAARANPESLDELYAAVHAELRMLASSALRGVPASLQPTELVSELFLKLHGRGMSFENRRHFFGAAARGLRQILADHGRAKIAAKRGGEEQPMTLDDDVVGGPQEESVQYDLARAIEALQEVSDRAAQLTELRYFCGLGIEDCASFLDVSVATANRDWRFAKAFLADYLDDPSPPA